MSKRMGLPVTLKMRHDAHYVEQLTSFSGAAIGRMVPVDKIRPNPDQPRKFLGDLRELTESIKEKGVLEPLLVRFMPRDDCYYIISGERRYHASRAAGLREVPCIEKIADDAETLELALIENLQRKDLTPFEEADGLQRLAEQFDYTHEDIAKKIAKARSSVTETMSLRVIPEALRKLCIEQRHRLEVAAAADCAPAERTQNAGSDPPHRAGRPDARRSPPRTPGREERRSAPAALHLQFPPGERGLQAAHPVPQEQRLARGTDRFAAQPHRNAGAG